MLRGLRGPYIRAVKHQVRRSNPLKDLTYESRLSHPMASEVSLGVAPRIGVFSGAVSHDEELRRHGKSLGAELREFNHHLGSGRSTPQNMMVASALELTRDFLVNSKFRTGQL